MVCNLKMACRRERWTATWDSEKLDTFNLVVFKVILGSFDGLASKWPVTPKRLVVERKD